MIANDNFDDKYNIISPAKNLWLVNSVFLLLWAISANWPFIVRHPGLIGALVAATGDSFLDWTELKKKGEARTYWKTFFMILLIGSLAYALHETADVDRMAGEAIERAGIAESNAASTAEFAARIGATNAWLVSSNLWLAQQVESQRSANLALELEIAKLSPLQQPLHRLTATIHLTCDKQSVEKVKLSGDNSTELTFFKTWPPRKMIYRGIESTIRDIPSKVVELPAKSIKPSWYNPPMSKSASAWLIYDISTNAIFKIVNFDLEFEAVPAQLGNTVESVTKWDECVLSIPQLFGATILSSDGTMFANDTRLAITFPTNLPIGKSFPVSINSVDK